MTVADLQRLYDYNYWATRKLMTAAEKLADDEFTKAVAGSYGSVRNTLVHMLSAEGGWLERAGGPPRGPRLSAGDFPTCASVAALAERLELQMREFLGSVSDADLARELPFTMPFDDEVRVLTIGQMLQHAATHSAHHRGQAALLMRALGHVPGNFDLLFYYEERRAAV